MSELGLGIASFPALIALIFLRVPIGLAMFLTGAVGLWLVGGSPDVVLARLKSETFGTFSSYALSIVPMFLLMGHFATLGGMSQALFRAADAWLGHRRGGVAMAAVGACAGFGAICGSSLATAATMGRVALPELRRMGYPGGFATATLAAGGTLGILIPPSIVLVIYAILAEQNIAKLFLAAIVPGLLAAASYGVVIALYMRRKGHATQAAQARPPEPLGARLAALVAVWPVLALFGVVVGGIYLGWFTPTEGAAVGAAGAGLVAWANGGLDRARLVESFIVTARSSAMIFFIVFGAAFYNGFLALTHVPQELARLVVSQGLSPFAVLGLILVFYLIFGFVMDSLSMILLTVPIFFPVIMQLDFGSVTLSLEALQAQAAREVLAQGVPPGVGQAMLERIRDALAQGSPLAPDELRALGVRISEYQLNIINAERVAIWFGVLVLIVVEVGLITPPVGMNLFIINAMDPETPLVETYRAVAWYVLADILRVVLLVAFPAITLFALTP